MEQLVVRLGSNASDPVHWLVWSTSAKEIIASGELADAAQLSSLTERAGQRSIIALIPASDVHLTWLTLPAKAARKALGAVPFMLEEELAQDIGTQFFALGPRKGEQQAVAAVSTNKMNLWLALIADAGLHCSQMLPDIHALPQVEEQWSLLQLGQHTLVRQDEWLGLQGTANWVLPAIEFHAKHLEDPLTIANFSDATLDNLANVNVEMQQLDVPMQLLATGALDASFNLLQGDFAVKTKRNNSFGKWRLAAVLAGVALLTSLVDRGVEVYQLSQQKDQLNEQIRVEFKRAFPETNRIVNVRSQMRQKLAALGGGEGGASLLMMMSQLSEAFDGSKVKPQTIRFDSGRGELRLQAIAENFEQLETFKQLAQQRGFTVEQGAINNRDNGVVGSLMIRS